MAVAKQSRDQGGWQRPAPTQAAARLGIALPNRRRRSFPVRRLSHRLYDKTANAPSVEAGLNAPKALAQCSPACWIHGSTGHAMGTVTFQWPVAAGWLRRDDAAMRTHLHCSCKLQGLVSRPTRLMGQAICGDATPTESSLTTTVLGLLDLAMSFAGRCLWPSSRFTTPRPRV